MADWEKSIKEVKVCIGLEEEGGGEGQDKEGEGGGEGGGEEEE